MSDSTFRFKQFVIQHAQSTLKVGTDAILLGAWADITSANKILDIGCGCGIITLMLAQRSQAIIDAVEIDIKSAEEAYRNVEFSKWNDRITINNISFQDFVKNQKQKYDLIVSNPPYYTKSLKSNDSQKNLAKHNDNLNFSELIAGISKLLKKGGKASIILANSVSFEFEKIASESGLFCNVITEVFPSIKIPVNRVLMEFEFEKKTNKKNKLYILDEKNDYTPEFVALTKEFYLKF